VSLADLATGALTLVVFLTTLVVLVLVHELGHFIVARRFGVRIHEFGIGFPPRARVLGSDGETIYTLNWLPLGGFVRLEGEDGGDRSDPRSFAAQPLWKRTVILAAGVVMNLLLAVAIMGGIAAFGDPTSAVRVNGAEPGSFAAAIGLRPGEAIEAVDGRRFLYFEGEEAISYLHERLGREVTLTVRRTDRTTEERQVQVPLGGLLLGEVQADSPAASIGLRRGDLIEAIDGRRFRFFDSPDASAYLRARPGREVTLTVRRADGSVEELRVRLRPADRIDATHGPLGVTWTVGELAIVPGATTVGHDPVSALRLGLDRTWRALGLIVGALDTFARSVIADPTAPPPVAGPVGIAAQFADVIRDYPAVFIFWLAGLLSANLALVNVLPLPPLDGGRIAVGLLQAAVGGRISVSAERLTYFIGFVLLMGFLLWVTIFDVLRAAGAGP